MAEFALIFAAVLVAGVFVAAWLMYRETMNSMRDLLRYEREDKQALLDRLQARDSSEFVGLSLARQTRSGPIPPPTANHEHVRDIQDLMG